MELRQLKYFLAVADARSFVGAANTLFVSRQAVSKAVGQLETELGVELFMRDSSGAFLTPAGLMFYDRIRSSVMELERVCTEMQRFGPRYRQRVRLAFGLGIMALYETSLQQFRLEQENLALDYQEYPDSVCLEQLREHKADLAICAGAMQSPEMAVQVLRTSPYGVLIQDREALRSVDNLELKDLSWIPLAGLQDMATEHLRQKHGLHLQYQGYDLYRLFSLTREGKCALLLPQCLIPWKIKGLQWLALDHVEPWTLCSVCLRSMENNVLYHTTIEELQQDVFRNADVSDALSVNEEERP